jgi:hypothetical protein
MSFKKEKDYFTFFHRILYSVLISLKINLLSTIGNRRKINPENQIVLFSDPRGGSTWLSEIINTIPKTALIWEPLHLSYVKQLKDLKFGWRQYIPDDIDWPEAKSFFSQALSGKIINTWTLSYTSLIDYLSAKTFIIKICRGNMLLPWLTKQFNFMYAPIYMVRHPFAVVNSQLQHSGWEQTLNKYKVPDIPFNDIFIQYKNYLESLNSKEEIFTAIWCISNKVPLNHINNNKKWITVHYENLLLYPEQEINRIFDLWRLPIPVGIVRSFRKKSKTAIGDLNEKNPAIQLKRWKRELTEKQIHKMKSVLEYFNFTEYSYKEFTPTI